MTEVEYLLICVTEECAEIIQIADKALRFGLDDWHPAIEPVVTNHEHLAHELADLAAVVELLHERGVNLVDPNRQEQITAKKAKVLEYMSWRTEQRAGDG